MKTHKRTLEDLIEFVEQYEGNYFNFAINRTFNHIYHKADCGCPLYEYGMKYFKNAHIIGAGWYDIFSYEVEPSKVNEKFLFDDRTDKAISELWHSPRETFDNFQRISKEKTLEILRKHL